MNIDYNSRVSVENYKGKLINYFDLSSLMAESLIGMLNHVEKFIIEKENTLNIFNITKATFYGEALNRTKEFSKILIMHNKKTAFLGVEGAKKILLNSVLFFSHGDSSKIKLCLSKQEALDWLSQ